MSDFLGHLAERASGVVALRPIAAPYAEQSPRRDTASPFSLELPEIQEEQTGPSAWKDERDSEFRSEVAQPKTLPRDNRNESASSVELPLGNVKHLKQNVIPTPKAFSTDDHTSSVKHQTLPSGPLDVQSREVNVHQKKSAQSKTEAFVAEHDNAVSHPQPHVNREEKHASPMIHPVAQTMFSPQAKTPFAKSEAKDSRGKVNATQEPTIHVTIGRVDIRAVTSGPGTKTSPLSGPRISLEEYLKERDGRRS